MLGTAKTLGTCETMTSSTAARSSWPVSARASSCSTVSSSTCRRFSSNRRAFSTAAPAWLATASMRRTSEGRNTRPGRHHTAKMAPSGRPRIMTGAKRTAVEAISSMSNPENRGSLPMSADHTA